MKTHKKIKELQRRLNKLKQEPKEQPTGKLPGLGQQFNEVGKTIGQLKDLIPKKKSNPNPVNYIEDPFVIKMKKWLLVGLTILIGGGALITIVFRIIKRLI